MYNKGSYNQTLYWKVEYSKLMRKIIVLSSTNNTSKVFSSRILVMLVQLKNINRHFSYLIEKMLTKNFSYFLIYSNSTNRFILLG